MTNAELTAYIARICAMADDEYDALAGPLPDDEPGPDWREFQEWREAQHELADIMAAQRGVL